MSVILQAMRKQLYYVLVLFVAPMLILSCVSGNKNQQSGVQQAQSQTEPQKSTVSVEIAPKDASMTAQTSCIILAQGSQCSVQEHAIELIRDKTALEQVWRKISSQGELPPVDFSKTVAAAVFMGIRNTGGYYYELGTTVLKDGIWTVEVIESTPGMKEMVTMAITKPYILFTIPKAEKDPVITIKQVMRK